MHTPTPWPAPTGHPPVQYRISLGERIRRCAVFAEHIDRLRSRPDALYGTEVLHWVEWIDGERDTCPAEPWSVAA